MQKDKSVLPNPGPDETMPSEPQPQRKPNVAQVAGSTSLTPQEERWASMFPGKRCVRAQVPKNPEDENDYEWYFQPAGWSGKMAPEYEILIGEGKNEDKRRAAGIRRNESLLGCDAGEHGRWERKRRESAVFTPDVPSSPNTEFVQRLEGLEQVVDR